MFTILFSRFVMKQAWKKGSNSLKFIIPSVIAPFAVLGFTAGVLKLPLDQAIASGIGGLALAAFFTYACFWIPSARREMKRHARDNVYGEAIIKLNEGFARTHILRRAQEAPTGLELMNTLTFLCGQLQQLFAQKTGEICSVCIKVAQDLDQVQQNADMVTLCRDQQTLANNVRRRVDFRADVKHPVTSNTCFVEIFKDLGKVQDKYYFNDHISLDRTYRNTSLAIHEAAASAAISDEEKKTGKLPYETVLVVPLSPLHYPHQNNPWIYGFLCLDSPTPHVFNEKYDLAILRGSADGIFDLVGRFLQHRKGADPLPNQDTQ